MKRLNLSAALALYILSWSSSQATLIVDVVGAGENDGSPFIFSVSNSAPNLFAFMDGIDGYDALSVSITDDKVYVTAPIIGFNPAQDIPFIFMETMGNYTAQVTGVGTGSIRLLIGTKVSKLLDSVTQPDTLTLMALGLIGLVLARRSRKA